VTEVSSLTNHLPHVQILTLILLSPPSTTTTTTLWIYLSVVIPPFTG
jgi:hypothetical protein